MRVTDMNRQCDIILGQGALTKLGIILDFNQKIVTWGSKLIMMKPMECITDTFYFVQDLPDIAAETDRMSKILDAKYQPANLNKVAAKNKNLTDNQHSVLHKLF